jgi:hypothetical protein
MKAIENRQYLKDYVADMREHYKTESEKENG